MVPYNLLWLIEKKVNDVVSPFRMIKKHEQRPVDEPCSLLKRLQWRADRLGENATLVQVKHSTKFA